MAFAMYCACGQRLEVTEGMASTSVPCPCGRTLAVPSLGELRQRYPQTEEPPDASERAQAIARVVLFVLGACVFGALALVLGMIAANGAGLSVIGYAISMIGYLWLLFQIVRVCPPSALVMVLVVPFFHWYYALKRWDIAKWPFLCNVSGLVLMMIGLTRRVS
jgi:ABC-type Na+ efflux pump permease subunit